MQLSKLQEICHDLKQSKNFQIFVSIVIIYSSLIIGVNSYSINGYLESFIFYSFQNKIKLVKTFVEIISCTMFFQTLLFLVFVAEDAIEVKQKGPG